MAQRQGAGIGAHKIVLTLPPMGLLKKTPSENKDPKIYELT
jgi:hypothetical protein